MLLFENFPWSSKGDVVCGTWRIPLRAHDFLVVELAETKLCILFVAAVRIPDPFWDEA